MLFHVKKGLTIESTNLAVTYNPVFSMIEIFLKNGRRE